MASSYRNTDIVPSMQNSSDEGELNSSDSDSDSALWSKKRLKVNLVKNVGASGIITTNASSTLNNIKSKKSKNANIWGSVLTEQSSHDISSSFGAVGMQHLISRGPESFDLPFFNNSRKKHSESSDSSNEEAEDPVIPISVKMLQPTKVIVKNSNGSQSKRKRKQPKNKKNVPEFKPGQQVNLNKRCDLSDTDPVDKVAEEIAFRLWERKRDLIRSLTEILGVPTTIDFFNKTEDIEKKGGLLTMQGVRRRTPGGTFLYLIRNDPKIDQHPISKIFTLEGERERKQWEQRKITKKKSTSLVENHTKQSDAMDCNDRVQNGAAPNPQNNLITLFQQPQDGAQESILSSNGNQKEKSSELSDGEIMDSDDDIVNAESFG